MNNLLSCYRPSIPEAIFQLISDQRERIEKVAVIAAFSATCLATTATLSFAIGSSSSLESPALSVIIKVVGVAISILFVRKFFHFTLLKINESIERDFITLCQGNLSGIELQDTMMPEEKDSIRSIAHRMQFKELVSSYLIASVFLLGIGRSRFTISPVLEGVSLFVAILGCKTFFDSSLSEVDSVKRAYLFTVRSGLDQSLFCKILKVFQSIPQDSSSNILDELRIIKNKLTSKEIQDNFGALAKLGLDPTDETEEGYEFWLANLFVSAFKGVLSEDVTLNASPEVIQEAGKAAISALEILASEDLRVANSLKKEDMIQRLSDYRTFLQRTGNGWEGMWTEVGEVGDLLDEGLSITGIH